MKLFAAMAISAGLIAGPMLAESHDEARSRNAAESPRGLAEAKTLNPESLSQAVQFERKKVQSAEREAQRAKTSRAASGEVTADYVGPSASSTSSADRMIEDENQVPAPGAKVNHDQKRDHPKR